MKLIVGLGNPGKQYEKTRHNVGFMFLDEFAKKNRLEFHLEPKFFGQICSFNHDGKKHILLKPVTYMNASGNSVSRVMNFYKLDVKDVLIVFDDLDLECGRVRLREKGSSGGHNGMKSIIEALGTNEFKRCKIGIRKKEECDTIDYVLGKFSETELADIRKTLEHADFLVKDFVANDNFTDVMTKYNTKEKNGRI